MNNFLESKFWAISKPVLFTILIILLSYAAQIILFQYLESTYFSKNQELYSAYGYRWSIIITLTASVYIILISLLIKNRNDNSTIKEYLKIYSVPTSKLLAWIGALFVMMLILSIFSLMLSRPFVHEYFLLAYQSSHYLIFFWLAIFLIGPVSEEILFRGFLFTGIVSSRAGNIVAIIISSLIWTFIHYQYDLYDLSQLFLLGLILGASRVYTGSLLTPIALHSIVNLNVLITCAFYIKTA